MHGPLRLAEKPLEVEPPEDQSASHEDDSSQHQQDLPLLHHQEV
ncbi:hypothetical protein PPSIR1_14840 [Plesiocystis pacifica SIR-1]|uniref:Uncharacterized protein n=1 Tax=Plesiocystis pacifica SIR-1 TaxID=391625 RepID=A6GJM4_9BACT|nr:hypothetical protein PPSIR1_14840 [Plesiocystis pacifica SIR-1]